MPKLHVPPAPRFECSDGGMPCQPSGVALDGSGSPTVASISGQLAQAELWAPARLPLTQWNQSASASPQNATVSRFEELVAEADTLLHNLKTVQPVKAEEPTDIETALASKRQQAASCNKLAIVRVRVSLPLCLHCTTSPGTSCSQKQQQLHQSQICFTVAPYSVSQLATEQRTLDTANAPCYICNLQFSLRRLLARLLEFQRHWLGALLSTQTTPPSSCSWTDNAVHMQSRGSYGHQGLLGMLTMCC